MPNWTTQQQEAIADRGHSLIVSAAAGSGKTAVLVERIVQLVREGCPVDAMLIVTFTNAAAGEMRLRIGDALSRAAQENPFLAAQVLALSRASISTLHRFCGNLLREQFQALGIDPAFRIGDEQECGVLSRQAMEDALYSCYEVGGADFMAADACYEQEELSELAFKLHRFMMTRPDPWAFLEQAQQDAAMDCGQLGESPAAALLLRDASEQLEQLAQDAADTCALCRGENGPSHYEQACAQDAVLLADLCSAAARGYEAFSGALKSLSYEKLGHKKKDSLFSDEIAELVKTRREGMKRALKQLAEVFSLSLTEAAADMNLTRAPLRGLIELVRTYDALYTAAKRQRGLMDFDDLEHGALEALTHEDVCTALRERYRYVFIDEYQDSSAIQEAIIGSFAREDGLFLVGDVKQSIYRFRQAEPKIFLQKAALFDRMDTKKARRIDLQNNFRSRANVLEGANAVFERIMRADVTEIDYDARERLIPGLPMQEDDPPVELHLIYKQEDENAETAESESDESEGVSGEETQDNERELAAAEQEALVIAKRIRELVGTTFYDAKIGGERTVRYRDIAILMRAARGGATLAADMLSAEGIPVFCDAGEGYFDIPEVRAMMALLEAIANGAKDGPLLAALRGPALGLSDAELAQIRIHTPDTKVSYAEAVRRYREEMTDGLAEKLNAFEKRRVRWRLCARHQGVDRLIERLYAETGFLAQAGALPGGAARQANLHLLTARARTFAASQGGSLHTFLRYAKRLRAGGDSMSASAIGESEDVVRIMTTHKSKGLEFPVVFVMSLGRKMSTMSARERVLMDAQLGVGLPCVDTALGSERDTLLRRAIRVKTAQEQLAEEVRILYVAMTRARERLILVGSVGAAKVPDKWQGGVQKSTLRGMKTGLDMICPMLTEAGAALCIREECVRAGRSVWHVFAHRWQQGAAAAQRSDETVMRLLAALKNAPHDSELEKLIDFTPNIQAAVRKTSVSAVLRDEKRAADDELHQRDVEIERLPRFMQEKRITGAQIGTVFHRMMRMLDLSALRETKDLAAEIGRQREAMIRDGVVTAAEGEAVPAHLLTDFFASPLGVRLLASERVQREWAFTFRRSTPQGDQLVQGVIDCCFTERGGWVLCDYKTDSTKDIPAVLEKHRPQIDIYAQALETITGMPVRERSLYLVRAGADYLV